MTKTKKRFDARDVTHIALGAVLIAVCSWISVPTTVPFTMQTFAVFCVLSLLGGRRGTMAIVVYLLLGAVGAPVFSNFGGGVGVLLGTTGGYILGFVFIGLLYALAERLFGRKLWAEAAALTLGLAVCYGFGTAWFMLVYARTNSAVGLMTALGWCVFPFIVPDLAKLALALMAARRIPVYRRMQR